MRMLRINWGFIGSIGEALLATLSRLSYYWPFSWRSLSALVMGVLLAKWLWILFAPQAVYTAATPEPAAGLEAGQIFGIAVLNVAASEGVALANVQLLGVFAASGGKPGFAILKLDDNRQIGVAAGEEVVTGTILKEVQADHVILERAGVKQRIELNLNINPAGALNPAGPPARGATSSIQQYNSTGKNSPEAIIQQAAMAQQINTLQSTGTNAANRETLPSNSRSDNDQPNDAKEKKLEEHMRNQEIKNSGASNNGEISAIRSEAIIKSK